MMQLPGEIQTLIFDLLALADQKKFKLVCKQMNELSIKTSFIRGNNPIFAPLAANNSNAINKAAKIEYIRFEKAELEGKTELLKFFPNLKKIYIGFKRGDIRRLSPVPGKDNLYNEITTLDFGHFKDLVVLKNLTKFKMPNMLLDEFKVLNLKTLPQLKQLSFKLLDDEAYFQNLQLLRHLPNVEFSIHYELNQRGWSVYSSPTADLKKINLKKLSITAYENPIKMQALIKSFSAIIHKLCLDPKAFSMIAQTGIMLPNCKHVITQTGADTKSETVLSLLPKAKIEIW